MNHGITLLPAISLRADASDRSEMVSQLFFGEIFDINEITPKWFRIRNNFDHYEGWADRKQVVPLSDDQYSQLGGLPLHVVRAPFARLHGVSSGITHFLPGGCCLPGYDGGTLRIAGMDFTAEGTIIPFPAPTAEGFIQAAEMFLGCPYLWGGKTLMGLDCSGLVQVAARMSGLQLQRDAKQQAGQGSPVNLLSEARPGDLAFFDDENGNIIHVGILLKDSGIIHASGMVRVDRIDHNGIFNVALGKYTHRLRLISRVFPDVI